MVEALRVLSPEVQMNLKVNPDYEDLCTPLILEEYRSLKDSIREHGLWKAIEVNEDGEILDGHHRYKACNEVGRPWNIPDPIVKRFDTKVEEKIYVKETNLLRRQLNDYQKVEMYRSLEPLYVERAKRRHEATIPIKGQKGFQLNPQIDNLMLAPNGTHAEKGKSIDLIAKKAGVSARTYYRAKAIQDKGSEALKRLVKTGQKTIGSAYNELKIVENRRHAHMRGSPPLPEGVYDVLLADPPWRYGYTGLGRGVADIHYHTMQTEDIINEPIHNITAKDSMLFLWATNPKIEDALRVADGWGFTYKTCLIWVKPHFGTGFYVRSQNEILMICRKGKIPIPNAADRPPSVLFAPKTRHSAKPPEVYNIIERAYPNRRYVELYSRSHREGWESWGLESLKKNECTNSWSE